MGLPEAIERDFYLCNVTESIIAIFIREFVSTYKMFILILGNIGRMQCPARISARQRTFE